VNVVTSARRRTRRVLEKRKRKDAGTNANRRGGCLDPACYLSGGKKNGTRRPWPVVGIEKRETSSEGKGQKKGSMPITIFNDGGKRMLFALPSRRKERTMAAMRHSGEKEKIRWMPDDRKKGKRGTRAPAMSISSERRGCLYTLRRPRVTRSVGMGPIERNKRYLF